MSEVEGIVETTESAPVTDKPRDEQGRFAQAGNPEVEPETPTDEIPADEEHADEENDDDQLHDKKRRGKSAEARIDELTRKFRDAERRAEALERLVTGQSTPDSPQVGADRPKPDDFSTYDDYIDALTDWKVEQKFQRTSSETAQKANADIRAVNWESRVESARTSIPDYDTVVGSSELPVAQHVADALMESERGPELAYYMATHPTFADQLNRMSPVKAAVELGKLETSLTAPPVKAASKAPPPATPIKTTASSAPANLANADMDTFIKMRREQGASWVR